MFYGLSFLVKCIVKFLANLTIESHYSLLIKISPILVLHI